MQQLYILNVELMKYEVGRVGSDFLLAIAGRVNVSPG